MTFVDKIKQRYRKDPVQTGFMGAAIVLAMLTFIKPEFPLTFGGIAATIGISMINLMLLTIAIIVGLNFIKNNK